MNTPAYWLDVVRRTVRRRDGSAGAVVIVVEGVAAARVAGRVGTAGVVLRAGHVGRVRCVGRTRRDGRAGGASVVRRRVVRCVATRVAGGVVGRVVLATVDVAAVCVGVRVLVCPVRAVNTRVGVVETGVRDRCLATSRLRRSGRWCCSAPLSLETSASAYAAPATVSGKARPNATARLRSAFLLAKTTSMEERTFACTSCCACAPHGHRNSLTSPRRGEQAARGAASRHFRDSLRISSRAQRADGRNSGCRRLPGRGGFQVRRQTRHSFHSGRAPG